MAILRQYSTKEYGGPEAELPATLPYGDTYLASDTGRFYKYNEDLSPVEISTVIGSLDLGANNITAADLKLTITPSYDDDTAAGVGGLTIGQVYQTTGSGAAPLNVAGILMIKQ